MQKSIDDLSLIALDLGYITGIDMCDTERRLMILEEENKHLRSLSHYKSEVERLKLELEYADSLKHKYRNMYNDVAVKLMYLQNTDTSSTEDDQIHNLNRQIEELIKDNENLRKSAEAANQFLEQEKNEYAILSNDIIPQLEEDIFKLKKFKNPDLYIETLPGPTIAYPKLTKSSKFSNENVNPKRLLAKSNTKSMYLPSFMRQKRAFKKRK